MPLDYWDNIQRKKTPGERESQRERERDKYTHTHTHRAEQQPGCHAHTHTHFSRGRLPTPAFHTNTFVTDTASHSTWLFCSTKRKHIHIYKLTLYINNIYCPVSLAPLIVENTLGIAHTFFEVNFHP